MLEIIAFSVVPLLALLGGAVYASVVTYQLGDWRPTLFIGMLLLMSVHQSNELLVFLEHSPGRALSGFGEYPETTANLLASVATVLLLQFVARERDLSEQLQHMTERLEERVQERTAELESFTYSVSHDLRTPLRAIDGYTQLLENDYADQLDDEGRRLLTVVRESTEKMSALIDDLLTLSRLGRREMETEPLDMEALVREAYDELCRSHPEASDMTFELHPLPGAVGDPSMIHHVLTNLLSNAVKFTRDEEAPSIEVGGEGSGDEARFFVRDNGVGFDMEYSDKLFGVFERLHDDEAFEGTGVGLAIVERILRRHDGRVWAESAEGDGATFFFTLPQPNENNE